MKGAFVLLSLAALAVVVSQASPFSQLAKKDHGKEIDVRINYPASPYSGYISSDLFSKDDIYVFKTKLSQGTDWNVDNCYLIHKGQLLDNDKTAEDYGIKSGDTIDRIVWESDGRLRKSGIWLLNLQNINQSDALPVGPSATVGSMKKFIEKTYGLARNEIYMITNGYLLTDDDAPVSKYNVQDKGIIGWVPSVAKH